MDCGVWGRNQGMSVLQNRPKKSSGRLNSPFHWTGVLHGASLPSLRIGADKFVRLFEGEETLFLLWFSWQKARKYTEKTAKLHRPLELKMYLVTQFLKIPHLNENQNCCNHGDSARENTRVFTANRTPLARLVEAVWQSAGWQWTNDLMLRPITNLPHYIVCHKSTGKGTALHGLNL